MSARFHDAGLPKMGTAVSFHSIESVNERRKGGNRFNAGPLRADEISSLAADVSNFERQLAVYSFGYLRVLVDGEDVAIFSPQDTACEPLEVPTTASFVEVVAEESELLLAAFPLTHLDPSRHVYAHRMSVICGEGLSISLIVSSVADESGEPSSWAVRLECASAASRHDTAPKEESPTLILDEVDRPRPSRRLWPPLLQPNTNPHVKIVVVGLGSSGSNSVDKLIEAGVHGVTFAALNTDLQALKRSRAPVKVQLGPKLTRGHGTGSDPLLGRMAALESTVEICEVLYDADMVFITTGLGGGTGTGAAPVVASLAKQLGALTVATIATPFAFEGMHRMRQAEEGLRLLCELADTVITLPNERLLQTLYKTFSLRRAFAVTDDVLCQSVQTILDLVTAPGLINLDFAVVRTIMTGMGSAFLGTGRGMGETRSLEATQQAISSPLLEEATIEGAKGVLINITGGSDLTLYEVNEASSLIREAADDDANIIFGAVIDEAMRDEMKITILAAGQRQFPISVTQPI